MPIAPYRPIEANRNATETHASFDELFEDDHADEHGCGQREPPELQALFAPGRRGTASGSATSATTVRTATRNSDGERHGEDAFDPRDPRTPRRRRPAARSRSARRGSPPRTRSRPAPNCTPTVAQSTGRHLRECSFPVGKSRSRSGSDANARLQRPRREPVEERRAGEDRALDLRRVDGVGVAEVRDGDAGSGGDAGAIPAGSWDGGTRSARRSAVVRCSRPRRRRRRRPVGSGAPVRPGVSRRTGSGRRSSRRRRARRSSTPAVPPFARSSPPVYPTSPG